jgi:hypothetical protein
MKVPNNAFTENFQPMKMLSNYFTNQGDDKQSHKVHGFVKYEASSMLQGKINEKLGIPAASGKTDNDFDFEKVAENVLSFVEKAIQKEKDAGASDEKLKSMLSDAKKGIRHGFKEAVDELKDTGQLTGDIKGGVKEARGLIREGLRDFENELFSPTVTTGLSSYKEANHYNLKQDANFSVTTEEGDEISISFNSDYVQQNVAILQQQGANSEFAVSDKISNEMQFSFEVNGHLNEDEQKAINELMSSLQGVSDLFFSGEFDQAFEQAQQVSMDTSQLAKFSMDLQRTETTASIREYQQVMPANEIAEAVKPLNNQLNDIYQQAKPLDINEQLVGMLDWINEGQEQLQSLLDYSESLFGQLKLLDEKAG